MDAQGTIDRIVNIAAEDLYGDFGPVTVGDALVVIELCNANGEIGFAYLSNVAAQGQVQLLARALTAVSAADSFIPNEGTDNAE